MRKASLISIGNELLSGETVNTNAAYLSAELLLAGIPVASAYVIADEVGAIARAFDLQHHLRHVDTIFARVFGEEGEQ